MNTQGWRWLICHATQKTFHVGSSNRVCTFPHLPVLDKKRPPLHTQRRSLIFKYSVDRTGFPVVPSERMMSELTISAQML